MTNSENVTYKWEETSRQSKLTITYKNIIGEREANDLLIILSNYKDHDKVIAINIYLRNVELFSPVFISNLFLLANYPNSEYESKRFLISIFLPYKDATTYSFSHITGLLKHGFFANYLSLFREDRDNSRKYVKYEPSFIISDSFLPSLYLNDNSFKSFFQNTYNYEETTQACKIKNQEKEDKTREHGFKKNIPPKFFPSLEQLEEYKIRAKSIVREEKHRKETEIASINHFRAVLVGKDKTSEIKQEMIDYFTKKNKMSSSHHPEAEKVINLFTDNLEGQIVRQYTLDLKADELNNLFMEVNKSTHKLDSILAYELVKIKKRTIKSEELLLIEGLSETYNINKYKLRDVSQEDIYKFYITSLIDKILTLANYTEKRSYLYHQLKNTGILDRILSRPLYFIILYQLVFINTTSFYSVKEQSRFVLNLNRVQLLKEGKDLQKKEQDLVNKYCDHLERVYNFVDSVYQGIYELSKNVVEHSSGKHGILNVRLFNYQDIIKIKKDNQWNRYYSALNEELSSNRDYYKKIIDISVTDDGEDGIIDTRHSYLKNTLKEIEKEEKDKETLKKEEVLNEEFREITRMMYHSVDITDFASSFHNNYFNIKAENHFATMYKKILGGYGLKIFTANIENNYGCYTCRSYSKSARALQNSSYEFINFFKSNLCVTNSGINLTGTHYNFVFPIVYRKIEEIIAKPPVDRITVGEDVLAMLDKFSFTDDYTEKAFIDKSFWRKDSNKASFYYYEHQITSTSPNIIVIPVYDFGSNRNNHLELDRSALLRFMAEKSVSPEYNHPYFIIVNVERQDIEGLLELLIFIHKYFDKNTFWSDKELGAPSCMIFYRAELPNIISFGNNGMMECVMFAGQNLNEFITLNNLLSYYQFASIPSTIANLHPFNIDVNVKIENLIKPPFFNGGQPILLDLLIRIKLLDSGGKYSDVQVTIFENNVHRLLITEI